MLGDCENCLLMSSSCHSMWSNSMTIIRCRCPETASMILADCDVVVGIKLKPDHLEKGNLTPMCSKVSSFQNIQMISSLSVFHFQFQYKTPKEKAVWQNTPARHPTEDDPDAQEQNEETGTGTAGSYTTDRASSGPDMDITFDGQEETSHDQRPAGNSWWQGKATGILHKRTFHAPTCVPIWLCEIGLLKVSSLQMCSSFIKLIISFHRSESN